MGIQLRLLLPQALQKLDSLVLIHTVSLRFLSANDYLKKMLEAQRTIYTPASLRKLNTSPILSIYNLAAFCLSSKALRNPVLNKRMSSMLAKMTVRAFSSSRGKREA